MTIVDSFFNTLFVRTQILRIQLFLFKYICMSIWKRKFMPNKGQTEFIRNEMRPAIVYGIGQLLGNFFSFC